MTYDSWKLACPDDEPGFTPDPRCPDCGDELCRGQCPARAEDDPLGEPEMTMAEALALDAENLRTLGADPGPFAMYDDDCPF